MTWQIALTHIHKLHPFMLTYKCVIRSRREFLDYKTIKHHYEPLTTHSFTFIVHQTRTLRAEKKLQLVCVVFIIEVINDVPSAKWIFCRVQYTWINFHMILIAIQNSCSEWRRIFFYLFLNLFFNFTFLVCFLESLGEHKSQYFYKIGSFLNFHSSRRVGKSSKRTKFQ